MHFERDREVGSALDEAVNPELAITLEAKDLNLDGVDESVKQGALADVLVEDEDVDKCQRVHMGDLRRIKAKGTGLGKECGHFDARALQFDDADPVEKHAGKIRPNQRSQMRAEFRRGRGVTLLLGAQIRRKPFDALGDLFRSRLKGGGGRLYRRDIPFERRVKLVESAGGLGGLAKDIAPAKSGEIVSGVVKTKLVDGSMRAYQFKVSLL